MYVSETKFIHVHSDYMCVYTQSGCIVKCRYTNTHTQVHNGVTSLDKSTRNAAENLHILNYTCCPAVIAQ